MPDYVSDDPALGLIIVSISKVKFCIDISYVEAIVNPLEFNPENVLEYSGNSFITKNKDIFPIIEFKEFFNLKSQPITSLTRMLLLEYNHTKFAFYVDKINEIIAFNKKNLNDIKFLNHESRNVYIGSIINYQDELYIMPDFNKIIAEFKKVSPETPIKKK